MSEHEHSYGEYQRQRKRSLPPCGKCLEAANAYAREHRRANPDRVRKDQVRATARNRALMRLAARHQGEYRQLLTEELIRVDQ